MDKIRSHFKRKSHNVLERSRQWHDPVIEIYENIASSKAPCSVRAYDVANRRWYQLDVDVAVSDDAWLSSVVQKHVRAYHRGHRRQPRWNTIRTTLKGSPVAYHTQEEQNVALPITGSLRYGSDPEDRFPTVHYGDIHDKRYLSKGTDVCQWDGRKAVFKRIEFSDDIKAFERAIRTREKLLAHLDSQVDGENMFGEMEKRFNVVPIHAVSQKITGGTPHPEGAFGGIGADVGYQAESHFRSKYVRGGRLRRGSGRTAIFGKRPRKQTGNQLCAMRVIRFPLTSREASSYIHVKLYLGRTDHWQRRPSRDDQDVLVETYKDLPATHGTRSSDIYLLKKAYPVGNGKLGAIPHGPPGLEKSYSGGNPPSPKHEALPGLRANIFANGTGHVDPLLGEGDHFGAYRTLGNFSVAVEEMGDFSDYRRTLDLTTGIHTTEFDTGGATFTTVVYCSFPAKVCVYSISTTGETLPKVRFGFENILVEANLFNVTCGDQYVKGVGVTQLGFPLGMKYESIARITGRPGCTKPATECSDDGSLSVTVPDGQKTLTIVIGAETNFDQSKGNAESGYSFRGVDPHEYVEQVTNNAATQGRRTLLEGHLEDYQTLQGAFTFDLPDPNNSAQKETAALIQEYDSDGPGDPFLEALLFDYARHLLITSSREDSLPANLAGRWTEELWPAWSGDYHANINLQMNYWAADQTGLSRTQDALWNYMEKNWVPRGSETAQLLYNASGWVVHNEMNIFGHTAMKNAASWAFCEVPSVPSEAATC
ncbi:alpha-L-fucosidase [Verticillium alfalfae VaMs.102]|uniref:Alpha-L-fucosidase n=1 Tax=Verticillium alfalfae (strain VaMs.102 / ATCC MYA-4576 / FGSC 10136) TaxID=526221 RepID=C9SD98_VERA1|nr:alpha-L-fucosidase [Verticillium alfalfae VaMs.102]EEY16400.1 alpha-L-fucosidase [Verticillium alfalfae VaMs.102]